MFAFMKTHHRRWASSSTSPQSSGPQLQLSALQASNGADYGPLRSPKTDEDLRSSPVSPFPPILPPIPRVASQQGSSRGVLQSVPSTAEDQASQSLDGRLYTAPEVEHSRSLASIKTSPSVQQGHPFTGIDCLNDSAPPKPSKRSPDVYNSQASYQGSNSLPSLQHIIPLPSSGHRSSSPIRNHYHYPNPAAISVSHKPALPRSSQPSNSLHMSKPGKGKLHLRNPMSLLMRRRSAQAVEFLADEAFILKRNNNVPAMNLPADYDPSIKGKGIHDFSAPRARLNMSYGDVNGSLPPTVTVGSSGGKEGRGPDQAGDGAITSVGQADAKSLAKAYTPAFQEHFEDGTDQSQRDTAINAEALADPTFIARAESVELPQDTGSFPPFARWVPVEPGSSKPEPCDNVEQDEALPGLTTLHETSLSGSPPASQISQLQTPASGRSRVTSNADSFIQRSRVPEHVPSTSSRFSFAGTASAAQERLLEELHMRKAAAKALTVSETPKDEDEDDMDNDGYFDPESMDDDAGLEERIPGINMDSDEEQENGEQPTNQVQHCRATGQLEAISDPNSETYSAATYDGIHEAGAKVLPAHLGTALNLQSPLTGNKNLSDGAQGDYDDDLYFDDGLIGEYDEPDEMPIKFDESSLDNEEAPWTQELLTNAAADSFYDSGTSSRHENSQDAENAADHPLQRQVSDNISQSLLEPSAASHMQLDQAKQFNQFQTDSIWDIESDARLHAYHGALANAAAKAAADGRFKRKDSIISDDAGKLRTFQTETGTQPDTGFIEQEVSLDTDRWTIEDVDDDYDDALDDDAMVIAANAEALANDEEGFYGQEFGFYAQAHGSKEAVFANGGYFGPPGIDGVGRRKSIREPNLTPITERSEFSMRNSVLSLKELALPPGQPMPSPGLSQSGVMHSYSADGDDMRLERLIKLRRDAFGGSESSSRGSPTYPSPTGQSFFQSYYSPSHLNAAMSSDTSSSENGTDAIQGGSTEVSEEEYDERSPPASPTITVENNVPSPRQKAADFDPSKVVLVAPMKKSSYAVKGHSRKTSGADSVMYVREQDEKGGERWVLERRRTTETGEVELIEREVVEGGRI